MQYSDAYFMDISAAHANATSRLKDNNMNGRRRDGRSEREYSQPQCARTMCVRNFSSWGIFTLVQWGRNLADLCSNFYRLNARTLRATRVIILQTGRH